MGLFGSLVKLGFGGPPGLMPWEIVNPQQEQLKTITGNLEAQPKIEDIARRYNAFNAAEIDKIISAHSPFADQIATNLSKNRLDWSKGIISKDLADQVQLLSASRAVGGGFAGTGAHNALLARNYAWTGHELQEKAQSSEESWLRTAAAVYQPGMFNMATMFLNPSDMVGFAASERDKRLGYTNLKKQFKYATDPMRGVEESVAGIADVFGTALMGYLGGFGGAAGGLGGLIGMGSGGGSGSAMQMLKGFFGSPSGSGSSRTNVGWWENG